MKSTAFFILLLALAGGALFWMGGFGSPATGIAAPIAKATPSANENLTSSGTSMSDANLQKATFGGGCFWCTEAVFERVKGVHDVVSGYAGGHVENPSYREVTTGDTGHAEVIQVTYNPEEVNYEDLLEIFFRTHNPTTLNRQGADVGPQYRSIVLPSNEEQREIAESVKSELDNADIWDDPIVTEIQPLDTFYVAEDYHQDYYENNSNQMYCQVVIVPKLEKFEKLFKDRVAERES